jgi:hypothetical protein
MFNEITLDKMKPWHENMRLIARIDKPHKILQYNRPIEVYCEDIFYNNKYTYFWLFDNNTFVANFISYPCDINETDVYIIANEMIQELLSKSDFKDLDIALEGKVPCEEFRDKYKSCNECKRYNPSDDIENQNDKDGCLGAIYSIPTHLNCWETEEKWNKIYGEGTENYKKFITEQMIGYMNSFMWACGKDKNKIKEVLDYGKNHHANKNKKLFK